MIKVAAANPILVDDSVIPTPANAPKQGTKKLLRKSKNVESSGSLATTNISPGSKGSGIKGKYGVGRSQQSPGLKNGSKVGRLNQSALDEINGRQKSSGYPNNRTTLRNIKTPNSVLSNDSGVIEYENTDSSEEEEETLLSNGGCSSFSPPGTAIYSAKPHVSKVNHPLPFENSSSNRLSSITEDSLNTVPSVINTSTIPIVKADTSPLSIKTDLLSSSLTYSDVGSEYRGVYDMHSTPHETPFKHLIHTPGSENSHTVLLTVNPDQASLTISSLSASFYIAENDSDSDFEMDISEADMNALLSPLASSSLTAKSNSGHHNKSSFH